MGLMYSYVFYEQQAGRNSDFADKSSHDVLAVCKKFLVTQENFWKVKFHKAESNDFFCIGLKHKTNNPLKRRILQASTQT